MRLHRVIEHLKTQNLTGVALDFLITVLGVFIGIQVSNWNGERQDQRRSHEVLVDLRQEFSGFDKTATELADFYVGSLKNEAVLLESLRAGRFRQEDREKVKDAVALGLIYGDPPPQSGTYQDLLSSEQARSRPRQGVADQVDRIRPEYRHRRQIGHQYSTRPNHILPRVLAPYGRKRRLQAADL